MGCNYCHQKFTELPFRCKFCQSLHCSIHRIPENHECKKIVKGNVFSGRRPDKPFSNSQRLQQKPIRIVEQELSTLSPSELKHAERQKKFHKLKYKLSNRVSNIADFFGSVFGLIGNLTGWLLDSIFNLFKVVIIIAGVYFVISILFSPEITGLNNENNGTFLNKISLVFESPKISTDDIELAIYKYTNEERKKSGIVPLYLDPKLSDVAREHSSDMAQNDFFDHGNLRGEDPTARAIRNRYNVHKEHGGGWYSDGIAENIGKMTSGDIKDFGYVESNADAIAKAQVRSWMESPGHRANILDKSYDVIGIGIAYDGTHFVSTQNFK